MTIDQALASVPRSPFLAGPPPRDDEAAPDIGRGQRGTPHDVLRRMLQEAGVRPGQAVLELGAGTGWGTAVLATLGAQVVAVERDAALVAHARAALAELGLDAYVHHGDGLLGWPDGAPYEVVLAGFAVARLPGPWLRQLHPRGTLVAPVGASGGRQELTVFRRTSTGLERTPRGLVRCAPAEGGTRT